MCSWTSGRCGRIKEMEKWISKMPKIELHCHLDGSISFPLAAKLLRARGENYTEEELRALMTAPAECSSLTEYLRSFDLPNEVLQRPQELTEAAKDLALCAAKENVRYIEVRFAPQFFTAEGLSIRKVLEAVIEGLAQAKIESELASRVGVKSESGSGFGSGLKSDLESEFRLESELKSDSESGFRLESELKSDSDFGLESRFKQESAPGLESASEIKSTSGIESGIIVCGMRGLSEEANLSMLKAAAEFLGAGVVGCDLAGDEKYYPLSQYAYFFEQARKYGMPFTIHAGECGSRENIRTAIELGASRIGHGIAMLHDKELQQLCAKKHIGVELCPTSNLQTQAISSIKNYPLREFMENGVLVSINTDNRTVSGTDLTHEFALLQETFLLSEEECRKIYQDSVEVCFAGEEVKRKLRF